VICLQNNREHGVFNGQRFRIQDCCSTRNGFKMDLVDELGTEYSGMPVSDVAFGAYKVEPIYRSSLTMDWGYCITTHKAQGSEWPRVAVFEELHGSWNASRWAYTAATRASEQLDYFV
jgi:exodeoxyribonuclease-5